MRGSGTVVEHSIIPGRKGQPYMEYPHVITHDAAKHFASGRSPGAGGAEPRASEQMDWQSLPELRVERGLFSRNRIVAAERLVPEHSAFDMLRTKLMQRLRQNNWKSVAITSPTPACGKTFLSLNLAFSLAHQKDCRTLLLDLDLRRPQVGKSLGMKDAASMEAFLKGNSSISETFRRHGDNLAIAANNHPVEFAAELLQSSEAKDQLQHLYQTMAPDVLLYDLPPMLSNDDVLAFLPNVDCVILVAAAEHSTLNEVDVCEQELAANTNMAGVVLNKCRYTVDKYGY